MEVDGEAPKKGLKILNEEKPDVKKAQENGHEELKGWVHRNAKKSADLYKNRILARKKQKKRVNNDFFNTKS